MHWSTFAGAHNESCRGVHNESYQVLPMKVNAGAGDLIPPLEDLLEDKPQTLNPQPSTLSLLIPASRAQNGRHGQF